MMTSEQSELLNKLQMAQIPKFMEIAPNTLSQEAAKELFEQYLPILVYMDAVAVQRDENGEHIRTRFIGVTENDALSQVRRWQEANGYELMQTPNPQYGIGEMWLAYFRQPMSQISLGALAKHFASYKETLGEIPSVLVPEEQRMRIGVKPAQEPHKMYARLSSEEAKKVLDDMRAGKPIPEGYQVGHSVGMDDRVIVSGIQRTKRTEITGPEAEKIIEGLRNGSELPDGYEVSMDKVFRREQVEKIEELDHYVSLKPLSEVEWDILLGGEREELSPEAEEVWKSYGEIELTPEIEDELMDKGYLTEDVLEPFVKRMIPDKLTGVLVQKEIGMSKAIPEKPLMEKSFSPLELAFDDCPEDRFEVYTAFCLARDKHELVSVTDDMRATIKAYQMEGKGPEIPKKEYINLSRAEALAYIDAYKDTPADTYPRIDYEEKTAKLKMFKSLNESNLVGAYRANYLQRSVLRDLAKEGHICDNAAFIPEFLSKIRFITQPQAQKLIEPHLNEIAGRGLIEQTNGFLQSGKIVVRFEIKTVSDCMFVFNRYKNYDSLEKAALMDLAESGVINTDGNPDKMMFTPSHLDEKLLTQYSNNSIGPRLKARINDLIEEARIGVMEPDQLRSLTISSAMHLIEVNSPVKIDGPASQKQIECLQKFAQYNKELSGIDFSKLTSDRASELIGKIFDKMNARTANNAQVVDGPATDKQRNALSSLVSANALEKIDAEKWKTLSRKEASALISSVPEEQRRAILAKGYAERVQGQTQFQAPGQAPADPGMLATDRQRSA